MSFCMGFPASDFPECGPVLWGYGAQAQSAVQELFDVASEPGQWRLQVMPASAAISRAMLIAESAQTPVVIADTQDNPGAGGDSNTTGMLHELLRQGAGRRWPGRVALGLMFDPAAAAQAYAAGPGAWVDIAIGTAVPTFTGHLSDPTLKVRALVRSLGETVCELQGSMMTGVKIQLGYAAAVEVDGILVALVSGKMQLLDRALLRAVGIQAEAMKLIVVKSSNHFRADFSLIASEILVATAAGPVAANPADLSWKKISPEMRLSP
jgi:microcystin degradation protein MlrC